MKPRPPLAKRSRTTPRTPSWTLIWTRGTPPMRNILAIAQKELKAYFSSPVGWVIMGVWALLYGYFFVAILQFFVRQSMQMNQFGMQGPQAMNVNQQLIRPLVAQNLPILVLFLL